MTDSIEQKTGAGNKWPDICIETMLINLVACLLTYLRSPWLGGKHISGGLLQQLYWGVECVCVGNV